MKNFYLIGENTEKSLSPYIHKWIYKFLNINADYKNQNIQASDFSIRINSILSDIRSGSIYGINITNPYKQKVIKSKIILSKHAKRINAINCIYNNNHLIGDNTDWIGFIKSLDYNKINLKEYNVKIIGAGGVSCAIIYSLQKLGINNFTIYNRTKTELIINEVIYKTLDLDEFNNINSENIFLINCIHSSAIDNIINKLDLNSIGYFYDLNYHKSKLHNILRSKDIKVIVGLDMLIYQAIKSVEIWLGYEFSNKIDIKEIKTYLKKKALC